MAAIDINREKFNELINGDKPLLVDFWAPWCSYCRRIASVYEKIAEQYADTLVVAKVNIDDEPKLADEWEIEVIPTLVIYKNGEALGGVTAPQSKAAIDAFIKETLQM